MLRTGRLQVDRGLPVDRVDGLSRNRRHVGVLRIAAKIVPGGVYQGADNLIGEWAATAGGQVIIKGGGIVRRAGAGAGGDVVPGGAWQHLVDHGKKLLAPIQRRGADASASLVGDSNKR